MKAEEGIVTNVVWSGAGPPEHPTFPITKGLTAAVVSTGKTINVGNVAADPRYLTAFGSTRSEIVVPVFDSRRRNVVGTIDIESENLNAFSEELKDLLEISSRIIQPLWTG